MLSRALAGGLVVAAGTALSVCSAAAADLPVAPRPVPAAPIAYSPDVYNWTGFYFGGHAGYGFADSSWSDPLTGTNNTFNSSGFIGGGQIGANVQFNALVFGLEGDFTWTGLGLKGSGTDSVGNTINTNVNWTSTATGRIGAAFDRLLIYGKGGAAFAGDQSGFTDLAGNTATTNLTRIGWTAGAGIEYGITRNLSAKIEYDYLGFGSQPLSFSTPTTPSYASNASLNVQEIKAGLNVRFGP